MYSPPISFNLALSLCVKEAMKSKCRRSRCGSIIVSAGGKILGSGHNSMPCDAEGECFKDNLPGGFKSDKTCCVHAEQRAIIDAFKRGHVLFGSTLFFIRIDENGDPKFAGKPYCSICSKMALDAGVSYFALMHDEGWKAYPADEYNELTFQYNG